MNETLNLINLNLKQTCPEKDQHFFGHGKILLSGEYVVLEGAESLAIPTKLGQSLSVNYSQSYSPLLHWKSFDYSGKCWFDHKYEFWHFNCIDDNPTPEALFVQKILQQVRKQNKHFLRDEVEVKVETHLGFPTTWGLGSSSSLIYNIAQWAYVSPFELLFKTHGGSGYDIACAQSDQPILYRKTSHGPHWSPIKFYPNFKNNLFFIYLGNKVNSRDAVKEYAKKRPIEYKIIEEISNLTSQMIHANSLDKFQELIERHEEILGEILGLKPIKNERFSDFNGSIKSLGAWGGDFILAATKEDFNFVKKYFNEHDLKIVLRFDDLISVPSEKELSESFRQSTTNTLH
jgi:mevalonate kinase